ncbi:hypothetical protein K466DRAFT_500919, partial [Polyporus arcularius HHB13444]
MLRSTLDDLLNSIYGDIDPYSPPPPPDYFLNRMILSARNEDVDDINQRILDRLPGTESVFHSVDSVI